MLLCPGCCCVPVAFLSGAGCSVEHQENSASFMLRLVCAGKSGIRGICRITLDYRQKSLCFREFPQKTEFELLAELPKQMWQCDRQPAGLPGAARPWGENAAILHRSMWL